MIIMKKYKKKVTKFGKLFVSLSILLGAFFGLQLDIYASVYKTGTSDHYSIQVSQLATGREEIIISWHNLYEGDYYNYVDLIELKTKGSNGTTYTFYLCLHGTDEIAIKYPNTDLSNVTVSTIQTWQFDDDNLSQLQIIVNRLNTVLTSIDTINTNLSQIQSYTNTILTNMNTITNYMSDLTNDMDRAFYDLDMYEFMAFRYCTKVFPGHFASDSAYYEVFPEVPMWQPYGRTEAYNAAESLAISPGDKYILVVGSNITALYNYSNSYNSPDYSNNSDIIISALWRRKTASYYVTGYIYENNSSETILIHHKFDTVPSSTFKIQPLYFGPYDSCPYLDILNLKTTVSNEINEENENMNTVVNDIDNIENQFNTDFNNNINAIDLNTNITTSNNFVNSANWVVSRFNTLTVNTPFGDLITFSMIIGLTLLLIGRIL